MNDAAIKQTWLCGGGRVERPPPHAEVEYLQLHPDGFDLRIEVKRIFAEFAAKA
jgi:hypothetical protein